MARPPELGFLWCERSGLGGTGGGTYGGNKEMKSLNILTQLKLINLPEACETVLVKLTSEVVRE